LLKSFLRPRESEIFSLSEIFHSRSKVQITGTMKKVSSGRKARSRSKAGNTRRSGKQPKIAGEDKRETNGQGSHTSHWLAARMAAAKDQAIDRPTTTRGPAAAVSHPERSNFTDTYITQISVHLEDPDHPVTPLTDQTAASRRPVLFAARPERVCEA
jgi:hypothetical protein